MRLTFIGSGVERESVQVRGLEVQAVANAMRHRFDTLVFGGSNVGLMEAFARAFAAAGGEVVSVAPRWLQKHGLVYDGCEPVFCDTLAERKRLMFDLTDAVLCYPGGLGTWDELFDFLAQRAVDNTAPCPPVYLYNWEKYYAPLLLQMESGVETGFIHPHTLSPLHPFESVEELLSILGSGGSGLRLDMNKDDPLLIARDEGEEAIDRIVREFCLKTASPVRIFRQDGSTEGYALIVPRLRGERLLTVPALQEADFMFHGNPGTTSGALADFVAECIRESKADHLRVPLLSPAQAERLKRDLIHRLAGWRIETALAALSPLARNGRTEPGILRKAIARAERDGFILEVSPRLAISEIQELHAEQWGRNNRSETFFQMLDTLLQTGHAELVTARDRARKLVAAEVDLLGSGTRHCYYAIGSKGRAPGCGTAVLGISWRRFAGQGMQQIYSFGRGAERYKYQYANSYRELFELRGFYVAANMAVQ